MIKGGTVYRRTPDTVAIIGQLPYIKPLGRYQCMAWTGGGWNPKRCDRVAEFRYVAGRTKKAHAPSRDLCWSHLFTHAIFFRVYDRERAERAWKKAVKTNGS